MLDALVRKVDPVTVMSDSTKLPLTEIPYPADVMTLPPWITIWLLSLL